MRLFLAEGFADDSEQPEVSEGTRDCDRPLSWIILSISARRNISVRSTVIIGTCGKNIIFATSVELQQCAGIYPCQSFRFLLVLLVAEVVGTPAVDN